MNPYEPLLKLVALAALVWGVWLLGDVHGHRVMQAKFDKHLLADAQQQIQDTKDLLAIAQRVHAQEQALAQANAAIADAYERGRRDAEAAGKHVVDELRAGTLRLSRLWRGCEAGASGSVSGAASGVAEPDAAARDREESAGRAIGAAAAADNQIRCLQAIALMDRGLPVGDLANGCKP